MLRILVWDGPNMDMALGDILDRAPTSDDRPNFACIRKWLEARAGPSGDDTVACVFVNVSERSQFNEGFHSWLHLLLDEGYLVYAKPKADDGSGDIDDAMVEFIHDHLDKGLVEVMIASHDAARFQELRVELAALGISAVILGFAELVNGYYQLDKTCFVDLEGIPGAFDSALPRRLRISNLPPTGALFHPDTGRLRPLPRPTRGTGRPEPPRRLPVPRTQ